VPTSSPFLDIRASVETRGLLYAMIEAVADQVFIPLTVGGGVNSVGDIRALLNAGADKVSINTAGVGNPELFNRRRRTTGRSASSPRSTRSRSAPNRWEVFTHGGRTPPASTPSTGRARSPIAAPARSCLTSMDRDGAQDRLRSGAHPRGRRCGRRSGDRLGGVGTLAHLVEGIVVGGADAVLAASIFHYGEFTIGQAKAAMAAAGIEVRDAAQ
jgi:cyclase